MVVGMQHQQQQPHASPATVLKDATTPPCSKAPQLLPLAGVNGATKANGITESMCNDCSSSSSSSTTNGSSSTTSSDCEGAMVNNRRNEMPLNGVTAALVSGNSGRVKLRDVNPYLVCVLCHGYFVDATSIVECLGLHSFCRSCIIKYLSTKNHCPICQVQINSSKPHLSLKPDKTLQDIVYKLVPGLFHAEMIRRNQFYQDHPDRDLHLHPEFRGITVDRLVYSPQNSICLSLEYYDKSKEKEDWENVTTHRASYESDVKSTTNNNELVDHSALPKRYFSCSAAVCVADLKKLIRMKFCIQEKHKIDLLYRREWLPDEYSLMDIAYIYAWKRNSPLQLYYRINIQTTVSEASHKLLSKADDTNIISSQPSAIATTLSTDKDDRVPAVANGNSPSLLPDIEIANSHCRPSSSLINTKSVDNASSVATSSARDDTVNNACVVATKPATMQPQPKLTTAACTTTTTTTVAHATSKISAKLNSPSQENELKFSKKLTMMARAKTPTPLARVEKVQSSPMKSYLAISSILSEPADTKKSSQQKNVHLNAGLGAVSAAATALPSSGNLVTVSAVSVKPVTTVTLPMKNRSSSKETNLLASINKLSAAVKCSDVSQGPMVAKMTAVSATGSVAAKDVPSTVAVSTVAGLAVSTPIMIPAATSNTSAAVKTCMNPIAPRTCSSVNSVTNVSVPTTATKVRMAASIAHSTTTIIACSMPPAPAAISKMLTTVVGGSPLSVVSKFKSLPTATTATASPPVSTAAKTSPSVTVPLIHQSRNSPIKRTTLGNTSPENAKPVATTSSSVPPLITLASTLHKPVQKSVSSSIKHLDILTHTKIPSSLEISWSRDKNSSAANQQKMVRKNFPNLVAANSTQLNGHKKLEREAMKRPATEYRDAPKEKYSKDASSTGRSSHEDMRTGVPTTLPKDKKISVQRGELSVSTSETVPSKKLFSPNILPEVSITLNPHPEQTSKRLSLETSYDVSCFTPYPAANGVPPLAPLVYKNMQKSPIKNLNNKKNFVINESPKNGLAGGAFLSKNSANTECNESPVEDAAKRRHPENVVPDEPILVDKGSPNAKPSAPAATASKSAKHKGIPQLIYINGPLANSRLKHPNNLNGALVAKPPPSLSLVPPTTPHNGGGKSSGTSDNVLDLSPTSKSPEDMVKCESPQDHSPMKKKKMNVIHSLPPQMIPVTMCKSELKISPNSARGKECKTTSPSSGAVSKTSPTWKRGTPPQVPMLSKLSPTMVEGMAGAAIAKSACSPPLLFSSYVQDAVALEYLRLQEQQQHSNWMLNMNCPLPPHPLMNRAYVAGKATADAKFRGKAPNNNSNSSKK